MEGLLFECQRRCRQSQLNAIELAPFAFRLTQDHDTDVILHGVRKGQEHLAIGTDHHARTLRVLQIPAKVELLGPQLRRLGATGTISGDQGRNVRNVDNGDLAALGVVVYTPELRNARRGGDQLLSVRGYSETAEAETG